LIASSTSFDSLLNIAPPSHGRHPLGACLTPRGVSLQERWSHYSIAPDRLANLGNRITRMVTSAPADQLDAAGDERRLAAPGALGVRP